MIELTSYSEYCGGSDGISLEEFNLRFYYLRYDCAAYLERENDMEKRAV